VNQRPKTTGEVCEERGLGRKAVPKCRSRCNFFVTIFAFYYYVLEVVTLMHLKHFTISVLNSSLVFSYLFIKTHKRV